MDWMIISVKFSNQVCISWFASVTKRDPFDLCTLLALNIAAPFKNAVAGFYLGFLHQVITSAAAE